MSVRTVVTEQEIVSACGVLNISHAYTVQAATEQEAIEKARARGFNSKLVEVILEPADGEMEALNINEK